MKDIKDHESEDYIRIEKHTESKKLSPTLIIVVAITITVLGLIIFDVDIISLIKTLINE